ncbi:MAG TPA: c-type cytochrome [Polyangiaceae bacterium]|nr:c-type cytochrome [Polyangiaceae bacterium]
MKRTEFRWVWLLVAAAACVSGCGAKASSSDGQGGVSTPAKDEKARVPDDGSAGAVAINSRGCGNCHNEGDSPLAGNRTPLPGYSEDVKLYAPNLTGDDDTGLGTWTDGALRLAIRDGIDKYSANLCPQMQHYRSMSDDEVDAIIAYLRKLPVVKKDIPGSICPPLKTASN